MVRRWQRPLLGKPVGTRPGGLLRCTPWRGPCRRTREGRTEGTERQRTSAGPRPISPAARPGSARPASVFLRVSCSQDLRQLAEWGVLLSQLHLPGGGEFQATPKPAQTHPSLTRTHLRLFTKRKGPHISNHSPVPNSDSPRSPQSRFTGPNPA